ncbi:restriction endonuclease subunit S [Enterococcus faecium]|uniref:restriction endonuclease subunit S n=1 Tax=Enterococcus faecium TaxID=1352 RepID=UPI00177DC7FE|nr:restriction endonuclease subunit S [Enterococcus faecium]MBD9940267.1 restriction endonuclease subunit S [Enterococcus faecium]MEB8309417.1 restriction endonuclease subunit S [Enterococcus faecium]HAQ6806387.1 restriction endonuclease subunit S [Enterococcus faecium]
MSNDTQPEIRFPGFTGDWEQRKLGDEFEKVNERNDGSFGKDKWISVAKMYFQDPEKVQSNNIDTRTYVMRLGDIAFEGHPNADFKFGRFVVNDIGEGVVSELFPIYRHKQEYDNNYWKYAIQLERIMAPIFAKSITSSGNSSNKLYPKHFLRQRVSVASIDEQHKIGDFLLTIDRTIALHQRKLDLLKETKKGFLQKMFPKNGAKVPEIRFPGFTGDWEQRKLGDITESFSGGTPTAGKSEYYGGDIPFIRSGEISSELTELFITENGLNNSSAKMVKAGDILYALYGATSGEVSISRINGAINQAILAIRPTKNDNSYLIVQWLRKQKDTIISTYLQGGQGNLSGSIVKDLVITLPQDKEEQNKIGTFFKQLDDTIALHQRKLDLLKETKKGFLQKMFV